MTTKLNLHRSNVSDDRRQADVHVFRLFDDLLQRRHEVRSEGFVDEPPVEGQGRAHGREGQASLAVDLLPAAADGQDCALRRVDDCCELLDAEHAQIGNGESAALETKY